MQETHTHTDTMKWYQVLKPNITDDRFGAIGYDCEKKYFQEIYIFAIYLSRWLDASYRKTRKKSVAAHSVTVQFPKVAQVSAMYCPSHFPSSSDAGKKALDQTTNDKNGKRIYLECNRPSFRDTCGRACSRYQIHTEYESVDRPKWIGYLIRFRHKKSPRPAMTQTGVSWPTGRANKKILYISNEI